MAHWKTLFDYEHLGCQDLPRDKDLNVLDMVVSITKLERRKFKGKGGVEKESAIADLEGAAKPMIMNKTNLDILANLFGSTEFETFLNKPFTLYKAKVKNPAGTGMVDGLRIRDKAPEIRLPELTPTHNRWDGAKQAIAAGNVTIEQIKATYSLSVENENLLTAK